jgi:tetratricopeptide (TPR) repeat protein
MSAVPDTRATRRSVAQRLGQQRSVRAARFQLVRLVRKVSYRALARGDKATAVRITSAAVRQCPDYPFAVRLYAHALLAAPASRGEVDSALDVLAPVVDLEPRDRSCQALYLDALHHLATLGASGQQVAARLRTLVLLGDGSGLPAARRFLERQRTWGRVEVIESALPMLLGCRDEIDPLLEPQLAALAHEAAIMSGDLVRAADIASVVGHWKGVKDEDRAHMAAALALARGQPDQAAQTLEGLRPQRTARFSRQLIASRLAVGDDERVLGYLDTVSHGLPDAEALAVRYDALRALGRFDEAAAVAAGIESADLGDAGVFRVFRDHCERGGPAGLEQLNLAVERFETESDCTIQRVAVLLQLYFELDRLDDVDRIYHVANRSSDPLLSPSARLTVAKALYVRRRFDEAMAALDAMAGVSNRWDAEKLRARILLERGDFASAVDNRTRFRDSSGDVDEVLYHALLQQRRFAEAFASYLPPRDRHRLSVVFGDRAEFGPAFQPVARRMVISQAGPGDELAIASTYASLRACSDELSVTCDPRLIELLGRSYPDTRFIPVDRFRRQPGSPAVDPQRRAGNLLFDLLTEEAMDIAAGCDGVVFGRSLAQLSIGAAPYDRYLVPPERMLHPRLASGSRNGSRRVGVVWRSEMRGPMRDIHYLDVNDLRPLLGRSERFVCLQHDVTDEERAALDAMASSPVEFRDDIDLRNDFEQTAALVAGLDHVVGIGTTVVELSAAVGTPTVMLQPTHFGTWRAMDAAGADYWHRAMRVVTVDEPWRRELLVERACRLLDDNAVPVSASSL